ncbi:DUF599 family protein [Thermodesulfobacteriota bacterium]
MSQRYYLAFMLNSRPAHLFLGKLEQYRQSLISTHDGGENNIVVVQILRNMIMSASFLDSTSIILKIILILNTNRAVSQTRQPCFMFSGFGLCVLAGNGGTNQNVFNLLIFSNLYPFHQKYCLSFFIETRKMS